MFVVAKLASGISVNTSINLPYSLFSIKERFKLLFAMHICSTPPTNQFAYLLYSIYLHFLACLIWSHVVSCFVPNDLQLSFMTLVSPFWSMSFGFVVLHGNFQVSCQCVCLCFHGSVGFQLN